MSLVLAVGVVMERDLPEVQDLMEAEDSLVNLDNNNNSWNN